MREDVKPCETICNNHNEVMWMLREFKKTGDMWYINQSIKLIKYCKKQGQSLENRLHAYVSAIEGLSFKRVYKPKKGKELKSWQKEA